MFFLGQYEHSIDDKGRMTVPSRYRDLLSNGAYITQGFDNNLMVMTVESFQKLSERINATSITDPLSRQLKRLIFSNADRVDIDKSGRILIPNFLRQTIQLNGSAFVVGMGGYFEIWEPENWHKNDAESKNNETNERRFAAFDLAF